MIVQEWRETSRDGVSLVFGLNFAPATSNDVAILVSTLNRLGSIRAWDRKSDQDCRNLAPGLTSLFCMLSEAVEAQMGRYHHSQPAVDLVRTVIIERWPERFTTHLLVDFNNNPATTINDMRNLLEVALARARVEVATAK
jgi:hypothetical protein